jgi:hypothetical protein
MIGNSGALGVSIDITNSFFQQGDPPMEDPQPIVQVQIDKLSIAAQSAINMLGALYGRLEDAGVLAPKPKPVDTGEVLEKEKIAPLPVQMAERLRCISCQIIEMKEGIDDLMNRLGV